MSKTESTMPDFSEAWKDWTTQSERQWNEFLNEMMGTEEFSQGLGRNLDVFLHFQKTMNEAMGSMFTALNMPTRTDVLALGDRLLGVEDRLASVEAKLNDAIASRGTDGTAPPKPRRTKRPEPASS